MLTFSQFERIIDVEQIKKGVDIMPDYQKMYFQLAARVSDVTDALEDLTDALVEIQQKCEEIYVESGEEEAAARA